LNVCRNYIDGEWVDSSSAERIVTTNPANGQVVAEGPKSTVDEVRRAIDAATRALAVTPWVEDSNMRTKAILKLSSEMRAHANELAKTLTVENGKILRDSLGEVNRSADFAEYYGGLARNVFGRSAISGPNMLDVMLREPVGVVAIIVPWNGPINLFMRHAAPALAAGNAVIIKPASYTIGVTTELVRLIAGIPEFPKGIVNYVMGSGETVGAELAKNPAVDMIGFTGDTTTGKEVMRMAAGSLKKLSLELGGKSPNIVLDDADIEGAIKGALAGAYFGSATEMCYAGTRILLHENIHSRFLAKIKETLPKMKIGDGLDPQTEVPPVISKSQMDRVLALIENGKSVSALVTGGKRATANELSKGFFIEPTVFDEPPLESEISQQEVFGPVLTVSTFKNEEELLSIANGTPYGLAAGIWTKNIDRAIHLAKRVKAGTVWINSYGKMGLSTEFGGYKQSGIGRTVGLEGLLEFTQIKRIAIQTNPQAMAM
jgi:betaine-aldehyde dehydrogenase